MLKSSTRYTTRVTLLINQAALQDMLAMELPYGERDRTASVDQYASIFPYAPTSIVEEDLSTMGAKQSGVCLGCAPFQEKKKEIGQTSPGDIDDAAIITTQDFKARLDQLSISRQLSDVELEQLLVDVKKLLGGDETKRCSGTNTEDDEGTIFSSTDEDQTQFTMDETQFGDQTQFPVNEDQTQFTIASDDQETQFSSDSQSLLSLIDNVFSRKSHDNERRGDSECRRRREGTASWSHGGSVVYNDEGGGENCMLSMCDSFLSCLICDGKSSDAVEKAARERKNDRRGGRKGSRERKHDNDEQRRIVAYREPSFVMDASVSDSEDSNNGGTVNDDSSLQDQQSSLLSGWNEATSTDKVDDSGVSTSLMSMEVNPELMTHHKEVVDNSTSKVEEHDLRQDVDIVDNSVGVAAIVEGTNKKERYEEDNFLESNTNLVTTIRASSPTVSIDDIISQTEQLSSGKTCLRDELDSKTSSPVPTIAPKKPWKEYTDPTTGRKYYSNGVITTWKRPDDGSSIIVSASPRMSAIKSQLKNEKKQFQLDSTAKNNGRFKSIQERVGIKSFFKRKK